MSIRLDVGEIVNKYMKIKANSKVFGVILFIRIYNYDYLYAVITWGYFC